MFLNLPKLLSHLNGTKYLLLVCFEKLFPQHIFWTPLTSFASYRPRFRYYGLMLTFWDQVIGFRRFSPLRNAHESMHMDFECIIHIISQSLYGGIIILAKLSISNFFIRTFTFSGNCKSLLKNLALKISSLQCWESSYKIPEITSKWGWHIGDF